MSRGPGRIECLITAVVDGSPNRAFSTEQMCREVYPGINRIEKKHRFAVARAMNSVVRRRPDITVMRAKLPGNPLFVFSKTNLLALADAAARSTSGYVQHGDYKPGGPWARAVRLAIAEFEANPDDIRIATLAMREHPDFCYIADFRIFDALFGRDAFDRIMLGKGQSAVIDPQAT